MEFSLHRELKKIWAGDAARCEVRLDGYIIDAIVDEELVEIQHGTLTAIRDKIRRLLEKRHRVRIVKPIIARKILIKLDRKAGVELHRRSSPKICNVLHIFDELVHFTRVFPHKRLTLEIALIEVEEIRYPGHGRRRWKRKNDFVTHDCVLTVVKEIVAIRTNADLCALLGPGRENLPPQFHTGDLARELGISRPLAQKIAYVLRHCGAANVIGKQGNSVLYSWKNKRRKKAA